VTDQPIANAERANEQPEAESLRARTQSAAPLATTETPSEFELKMRERQMRLAELETDITLRRLVAKGLLGLFLLNTLGALAIVILVGVGWSCQTQ
jgi:hypothetical protein